MHLDKIVENTFMRATDLTVFFDNEYVLPEHLLLALLEQKEFTSIASNYINLDGLHQELLNYIAKETEHIELSKEEKEKFQPEFSAQMESLFFKLVQNAHFAHSELIHVTHVIQVLHEDLIDSHAAFFIKKYMTGNFGDLLSDLIDSDEISKAGRSKSNDNILNEIIENVNFPDMENLIFSTEYGDEASSDENRAQEWEEQVVCINDQLEGRNPLIGREQELERTIQILCRKEKNNPLHIGEPGVGKTALVYGLANRINKGKVPKRLKGYKIYELNIGNLIAGTQYRGDFEKRLKGIMEGLRQKEKCIVYIDEIHNLVGAGQIGEGSLDASNLLKPYLESGDIRFIGSTTYEEFNKHFSKDKGLVRRFQQIDILEPSIEEAIEIVSQLKPIYEEFHNVIYDQEAIDYAVRSSAEFIANRFLPDKAIDLIDEAGAYAETHPHRGVKQPVINKEMITQLLYKICKIDANALKEENNELVQTLEKDILANIYGQDNAVRQIVETIQMSKAGLLDESKPIASLLFVGPTGVGKTELCKVLAEKLGISLVRFDMSEYAEKHTVAKLIGSPAGYVGYEDGGLLTDAIKKTPNCVLLLDEIEKAHSDIFNILLQVMDYAKLTDNKGNKADFRHVILIMTSNAGAQYAHQASVGFGSQVTTGKAMLNQVKKTFKPEFINRLNDIIVFNDMDETMAGLVLDKKVGILKKKMKAKGITLTLSNEAHAFLLKKGFSKEYGAREMDRVIRAHLTTLLSKEVLFGSLKGAKKAKVILKDEKLTIGK
ncbi:MAG: AAA family ATPase [Paludibacteraceae bacterium]|nr:AAA family ATPase [Paludibacteraceae bacterium]